MDKVFDWTAPLVAASTNIVQGFIEYIPQMIGALAMIIFGWIVARILKALTIRLGRSLDRLTGVLKLNNTFVNRDINTLIIPILGNVVFWLVILFFLTSSTNILGLTVFSGWLDQVIGHMPKILSGVLIIFAGAVFGNLVADTVRAASQSIAVRQRNILARAAQILTFAIMIIIGVDQIGVDITVLIAVMTIAFGALLGGVAIAFSLGSKSLVSNLIAVHYLNKDYRVGEQIQVGNRLGTILEITPVSVILETEDGRLTIPAKIFSDEISLLVNKEIESAS